MKNENYTISFDEKNQLIVSSMNYLRMDDYMSELENELQSLNFEGTVLFDLLLCNGFATNRFINLDFKKDKFDLKSCKVLSPSKTLIKTRNDYYRQFPKNIKEGNVLSEPTKFLLLKGKDLIEKHY